MLAVAPLMTGPVRLASGGKSDLTIDDVRRWLRYYIPCLIEHDPDAFKQRQQEIDEPKISAGVLFLEPQKRLRREASFEHLALIQSTLDQAIDANWPGMTRHAMWPYLTDDDVKRLPLLAAAVWVFVMRGPSRPSNMVRPPDKQKLGRFQNLPQKEAERLCGHHWTRIDKAWKAGSAQVFRATRQRIQLVREDANR